MSLSSLSSTLQGSIITSSNLDHREKSLANYVTPKIHCDIKNRKWSKIVVAGNHTRAAPAKITDNEKQHQLFNWQRPTATQLDEQTLQINCFPGIDYVEHYARLVATYLDLHKRVDEVVVSKPGPDEALGLFRQSNLSQMGQVDVVVIGDLHCFRQLQDEEWHNSSKDGMTMFKWQKSAVRSDHHHLPPVAFLGCEVSLWGDVSGQLVRALNEINGVKCCFYIAKAGSLRSEDIPNTSIVTGTQSLLHGEQLTWRSPKSHFLPHYVHIGSHITVPSPLVETEEWLAQQLAAGIDWVDCETGHMAKSANEHLMGFTYLHVISDNVARHYDYNLSNEDEAEVASAREKLFDKLWLILQVVLGRYGVDINERL